MSTLKKIPVLFMLFMISVYIGACNGTENMDNNMQTSKENGNINITTNENDKKVTLPLNSEKFGDYSSNMKYFQTLIALGSYNEIFRLGGEDRDPEDVIVNDKIMLPEGKVVTVIGETPGTEKKFINLNQEKLDELVMEIEKSKVVEPSSVNWLFTDTVGASIEILLINTSAEYIKIGIHLNNANNHMFGISYENVEKGVSNLCLQSETLTLLIKELTGWKVISYEDLADIIQVSYTDIAYDFHQKFELTTSEIEILTNALSDAIMRPLEDSSPRNIKIEALRSNGETIHMIWCEYNGSIGVEGVHYQLKTSVAELNDIFLKNRLK